MTREFYNSDCMEVMAKMPDKCIDLTLTDIPYNLDGITEIKPTYAKDIGGVVYQKNRGHSRKGSEAMNSIVNNLTFDLDKFLDELVRITSGTIVIFCSVEQQSQIFTKFRQVKNTSLRKMVWEKTNAFPNNANRNYLNNLESIVCLKFPNATFNNTMQSSVLTFPIMDGFTRIHPTEKNHELIEKLILDNTSKGDTIFDPCMGSGVVCLMALKNGRNTIGCEINKEYFDKAVARIEDKGFYQMNLLEDFNDMED